MWDVCWSDAFLIKFYIFNIRRSKATAIWKRTTRMSLALRTAMGRKRTVKVTGQRSWTERVEGQTSMQHQETPRLQR